MKPPKRNSKKPASSNDAYAKTYTPSSSNTSKKGRASTKSSPTSKTATTKTRTTNSIDDGLKTLVHFVSFSLLLYAYDFICIF